MPLSAAHVEKLRRAWFAASGELVTNEEAWDMATRVLVFFDALARCPAPGVDKSGLTPDVEAQVAEWLGRITVPESVVNWYLETLEELARDRESVERATTLNRERTRRSIERQLATLTDLRVRAVIRDEHYLKKRAELLGQLTSLEEPNPTRSLFEPARAAIQVLNEAKNRFLAGGVSEKRSIVEAIALNPTLLDKKLLFQATKPFAILDGDGQIPVPYPHRDLNPSFVRERDAS